MITGHVEDLHEIHIFWRQPLVHFQMIQAFLKQHQPVVDIVDVVDSESDVSSVDFGDDGQQVHRREPSLHLHNQSVHNLINMNDD